MWTSAKALDQSRACGWYLLLWYRVCPTAGLSVKALAQRVRLVLHPGHHQDLGVVGWVPNAEETPASLI